MATRVGTSEHASLSGRELAVEFDDAGQPVTLGV
jgi:hypothetical protein